MAEYQLTDGNWVFRRADNGRIQLDAPGWAEYQQWLADGNNPDPAGPLPVPSMVSAWQVRKALNLLGWRQEVEDFVAQADQTTKDGWLTARDFYRTDPLVIGVGQILGKTEEEMDNFFRLADTL